MGSEGQGEVEEEAFGVRKRVKGRERSQREGREEEGESERVRAS